VGSAGEAAKPRPLPPPARRSGHGLPSVQACLNCPRERVLLLPSFRSVDARDGHVSTPNSDTTSKPVGHARSWLSRAVVTPDPLVGRPDGPANSAGCSITASQTIGSGGWGAVSWASTTARQQGIALKVHDPRGRRGRLGPQRAVHPGSRAGAAVRSGHGRHHLPVSGEDDGIPFIDRVECPVGYPLDEYLAARGGRPVGQSLGWAGGCDRPGRGPRRAGLVHRELNRPKLWLLLAQRAFSGGGVGIAFSSGSLAIGASMNRDGGSSSWLILARRGWSARSLVFIGHTSAEKVRARVERDLTADASQSRELAQVIKRVQKSLGYKAHHDDVSLSKQRSYETANAEPILAR